jgi:hypothetical protein
LLAGSHTPPPKQLAVELQPTHLCVVTSHAPPPQSASFAHCTQVCVVGSHALLGQSVFAQHAYLHATQPWVAGSHEGRLLGHSASLAQHVPLFWYWVSSATHAS